MQPKKPREQRLVSFFKDSPKYVGFIGCKVSIPRSLAPSLDFETSFNYLRDGKLIKIDTADLPNLLKQGTIVSHKQLVRAVNFEPNLWKHGFEIKTLPAEIVSLLEAYKSEPIDNQRQIREKIRNTLEKVVSQHFGLPAISFDTVYRNTKSTDANGFKSVPLVHIDFPENLDKTFKVFSREWGGRVRKKLGDDKYCSQELEFMVNIWMPFDTVVASPLVCCSKEKIEPSRLHEYDAVRRDGSTFRAVSLTPPLQENPDPWYHVPDMPKGQCYVFFSNKSPHSAADFPEQHGARESIEVRVGVFKKP